MRLYFGPLPPSRGVQRGPNTSVALQSTQFGALIRSPPPSASYTPAGQTWEENRATSTGTSGAAIKWLGMVSRVAFPDLNTPSTLLTPIGDSPGPGETVRGTSASACIRYFPPGNRPPVSVIKPACRPPR